MSKKIKESSPKYENEISDKYLKLTKTFNEIIKNHSSYVIKINDDTHERNGMDVFDGSKKIMSVNYEILGSYDNQLNIFYWACNHQLTNKHLIKLSKNIKKSKKTIGDKIINFEYSDIQYLENLYYYLSNSMFFIVDKNIEMLLKYCICTCNGMGILDETTAYMGTDKPIKMYYIITDIIGM